MFKRSHFSILLERIQETRKFIQVVSGPRQVGKTTMVKQVLDHSRKKFLYYSADAQTDSSGFWISTIWDMARLNMRRESLSELILCIDEVQKIDAWSEFVKKEWDHDTLNNLSIKVILLGSSRLLIEKGLSESLAGRFETISMGHWTYSEMNEAFGIQHNEFVFFGAYPGATGLISNEERWKTYIRDSLIETAISKDIFLMTRINKPVLLRRMFEFTAFRTSEIISYTKMLGQLQDAGNTVTLAHYLELLSTAGLSKGLEKFSREKQRQRASSPKLQVYNTALSSCYTNQTFSEISNSPELWGRFVESAIGAQLLNISINKKFNLYYWRERNFEVDFVLEKGKQLVALEVKSGRKRTFSGLNEFKKRHPATRTYIIGTGGIPWQEFLETDPIDLF